MARENRHGPSPNSTCLCDCVCTIVSVWLLWWWAVGLFGVLSRINIISVIQKWQFTIPCFLDYFNQYIILTLADQSWFYSHDPEGKGENHYYQTLVCLCRRSNPQPPAHEADALTNRPPRRFAFGQWGLFFNVSRVCVECRVVIWFENWVVLCSGGM